MFFAPDYSMFLETMISVDNIKNGEYLFLPSGTKTTLFLEDMISSWKKFNKTITLDPSSDFDSMINHKIDDKTIILAVEGMKIHPSLFEPIAMKCRINCGMMLVQIEEPGYNNLLKEYHQNQIQKALNEFVPKQKVKPLFKECSCASLELFRFGCRCK